MSIEEALLHLRIDGWHVAPGVIPPDEVEAVRKSVQATSDALRNTANIQGVDSETGLIGKNQSLAPYLADQRILGVAEAFLGPHVRISFTTGIINNPGNARGGWHSDWPFNQQNAGHIPAPYHDAVTHLTTIWMLSPFSLETGGTLIVPGSHRADNNPTGDNGVDPMAPYPTEMQATGDAGSVLLFDSRLWHATATNLGTEPRVGVAVRFAPWWLNIDSLMPGSDQRRRMVDEVDGREPQQTPVPRQVFESLPDNVRPLFRHWVRD
ncbi:MAG: phytanoyl-CoA dioxygenase family protein [Chloroflexi bacterium]|nr:phytanoyl-CoA dioxygenase family protein [Chloroflexota bacterium]